MAHVLHRVDTETVRDFEFRSAQEALCPVVMRYGERNNHPAQGNAYAVQFEHPCTMGSKPHSVHLFSVLIPGADQAFMVLWGQPDDVFQIQEELHEHNAEAARG
jgi:hypothetical protein